MNPNDRIQDLMDDVYNEWRKDENVSKSKWDVLDGFSDEHKIAVLFGNFNYQVENGGLSQWIFNGYFHDDSEKLTEYLEAGKELDERFVTILDKIYKLDQLAQETGCDRDGYYTDPDDEDAESHFIGSMIDCDEFDKWYYSHCGEDDWWETVCRIIDKMAAHDIATVQEPADIDTESKMPNHLFSAYIENANNRDIGGFTIPLPTSPAEIRPFLEGAEIIDWRDMKLYELETHDETDLYLLTNRVNNIMYDTKPTANTLNELNFLAARVAGLDPYGQEIFMANIEARRNCDSIAEIINLTFSENINRFDVKPAYTPEQYGDFLVNSQYQDDHADAFNLLQDSDVEINKSLAAYIEKLEQHADLKRIGQTAAKEENGVFTEQGYLTGGDEGLLEIYRNPEDIPFEYIVQYEYPDELRFLAKHIPPNTDRAELEYLAEKIQGMDQEQKKVFGAVVEAGLHCGSVAEIINTTENLDCFRLQPFIDELSYGKHRLEQDYNDAWESFSSLGVSSESSELATSKLFRLLYHTADAEAYGQHAAKEDGGVFTKQGLLTEESGLREVYRGTQDLPQAQPVSSAGKTAPMAATTNDERAADRSAAKPSVLAQIDGHRESQRSEAKAPRERDAPEATKKKSDPEL